MFLESDEKILYETEVNARALKAGIGGFHVTSSPPCWWTVNKRSLISLLCLSTSALLFMSPENAVVCVSRDCMKTIYWWKGDWLCSKFTYKYQKRSEHDFWYISKLAFLDARQPANFPPPPPSKQPTTFPSPYLQNLFPIVTPADPRLILTPHPHPGAPINYERFLYIYSSRIHNWNSVCIKLSRICWAWLSVWPEVECLKVWF